MREPKKIVPAVARMERAAQTARKGRPLRECLPGGAAGLSKIADEVGQVALEMRLTRLTQEEQASAGDEAEEELAHALEAPLRRCPDVQEATGASPDESRAARELIGELGRVLAIAEEFAEEVADGRRFVGGLVAHACLRLVEQVEGGMRLSGTADPEDLLGETAGLRARVRAYLEEQAAARADADRALKGLAKAAEAAEADALTAATMETIRSGGRPDDEAVRRAAAHLLHREAERRGKPR